MLFILQGVDVYKILEENFLEDILYISRVAQIEKADTPNHVSIFFYGSRNGLIVGRWRQAQAAHLLSLINTIQLFKSVHFNKKDMPPHSEEERHTFLLLKAVSLFPD
jgi:hypothetical protein